MAEKKRFATESNIRILVGLIKNQLQEYLTDEQITEVINEAIRGISGISFKKEDQLPDSGETGIIYLIPNSSSQEKNVYDEYFWSVEDSQFELLGTTAIDLQDYVTKTELSDKGYITSKQLAQKLEPFLLETDLEAIEDDEIIQIWNDVWKDLHGEE